MISIIIPIYNAEKYLDRLFVSLQNQNDKDFEIICIFQKSNDNGFEVLKKWSENFQNFKIELSNTPNPSANRNQGLSLSKGEYFTFVDADDEVTPNFVEDFNKAIKNYHSDLLLMYPTPYPSCMKSKIFNTETNFFFFKDNLPFLKYICGQHTKGKISKYPFNYTCTVCKAFSNKLRKYIRFDGCYLEDYTSSYKQLFYCKTITCITGDHYHYYNNPGSTTNNPHSDYFDIILKSKYDRALFFFDKNKTCSLLSIDAFYNTFNTFLKNSIYFLDKLDFFNNLFMFTNELESKLLKSYFSFRLIKITLKKIYLIRKWKNTIAKKCEFLK